MIGRRGPLAIVIIGGVGAILALLVTSTFDTPSISAAEASPSYSVGEEYVPDQAQDLAMEEFNAYMCKENQLGEVVTSGATTLRDLDALLPKLGYGRTSDLDPATPVYAAVVTGDCAAGDEDEYRTLQGYLLFDGQGRLWFARVWREGLEPVLTEPFGSVTDNGLADV